MHSAGEALGRIPLAIAELWGDAAPLSDTLEDAGPLVLWVSAMLALHEQGNLIGDLIEPFRHWKVTGPRSRQFVKPGTDCLDIETFRRVAVVSDPVRASLQMIDWFTSVFDERSSATSYTVRQLISDQTSWELWDQRARDAYAKIKKAIEKGSFEEHYYNVSQQHRAMANQLLATIRKQIGVERLRTLCDAENGDWSARWLRQKRAYLCLSIGFDESQIDGLTVPKFAEQWQATQIARQSSSTEKKSELIALDSAEQDVRSPKVKRSTEQGEARAKIIAGLTARHKYENGSCLSFEPIGARELARQANVSEGSVSKFFKQQFGSHQKYRSACQDHARFAYSLKMLNGELTPSILYGSTSIDERHSDAHD